MRQQCTAKMCTNKFIKFSMPIVSILNMNVWWSLVRVGECDELKAERQIYSFANSHALVGVSFVRSPACLPCLPLLRMSTLDCIIMIVQVHEICRLLSIACHGKRQLLLSVANRIASFYHLATTKDGKETKMETLTAATSSYKSALRGKWCSLCVAIMCTPNLPTDKFFIPKTI